MSKQNPTSDFATNEPRCSFCLLPESSNGRPLTWRGYTDSEGRRVVALGSFWCCSTTSGGQCEGNLHNALAANKARIQPNPVHEEMQFGPNDEYVEQCAYCRCTADEAPDLGRTMGKFAATSACSVCGPLAAAFVADNVDSITPVKRGKSSSNDNV
eukprot:TRINITY_DN54234_c0_g1_i1.p2 TRINITY_DN54234_c0_g1~~TRINITY_DN54234_c0_g1_i1.p2  ORF type:complete len:156 (+),score=44.43 TRINITY_DN54234_c0_g1_i1:72-539(+)